MKTICGCLNSARVGWQFWGIFLPLCLLVACDRHKQNTSPPSGTNSTNPLAVTLSVWPPDDIVFRAPATISIQAEVTLGAQNRAGNSVRVDFFADTNFLGSRNSVWHDEIRPDPHSRNAQPMIIVPAGFLPVRWVWNNIPAGNYSITAQATGSEGRSASSAPLNITVLPSATPQAIGERR